jgi:hypothetical protein
MPTAERATRAFEIAADAARSAEDEYRRRAAAEIARLAADRTIAFRRVRLIDLLEHAAHGAEGESPATPVDRQRQRLCQEFGWSDAVPVHKEVLDRVTPVCRLLAEPAASPQDVQAALHAFEAWFQDSRGVSVYTLFDEYVQERPVVDF